MDDFNHLAHQLQSVTEERAFWNAASAYELRTPVTILRGRIQGLADGVFKPNEAQSRRLLHQVERLGRLVEDFRAVRLAENGHLALQWQGCALSTEIQDVTKGFCETFAAKGLSIRLDLQATRVQCDPMRIRQALPNAAVKTACTCALHRVASAGECTICSSGTEDAGARHLSRDRSGEGEESGQRGQDHLPPRDNEKRKAKTAQLAQAAQTFEHVDPEAPEWWCWAKR